ncbi:hypothetical protein [Labilibaculum euxinus]
MQNKELATQAPKGKEGDTSLIEASLIDVAGFVSQDQLIAALDKVKAAKEKALEINTELNEVIAKYARNKRK